MSVLQIFAVLAPLAFAVGFALHYLVPSLALRGIVAYVAMLTTLIGIDMLKRRGVVST